LPHAAHILQVFSAPRRIRLVFETNANRVVCPLTGAIDDVIVIGLRTRPYGVSYEAFEHDLSPYYRSKEKDPWLPVHPQPGGILYRDWPAVAGAGGPLERPAKIVMIASQRLATIEETGVQFLPGSSLKYHLAACGHAGMNRVLLWTPQVSPRVRRIGGDQPRTFALFAEL
jgi:hypothetical protein